MAAQVAGELYESITGQLFEIGRQLRQSNGYPFDPARLRGFLQLAIEGKFDGIEAPAVKLAVAAEPLILEINYGQSLEAMIAAGHYDWTNSDITPKRLKVVGEGTARFKAKVFHFGRDMSSEDAVAAMKTEGWDASQIEHVLAFGAKYPEEQRKYPIIGLGSSARVSGYRGVPCLYRRGRERYLRLAWWSGLWFGDYRFLAVRPVSSLGPSAV